MSHIGAATQSRTTFPTFTAVRKSPVGSFAAHGQAVARRNVGVHAAFDESPKEPITPQQNKISKELMQSMEKNIGEALEAETVSVTDVYGDYQHVCISVVSKAFEGLNAVKRQRLVYQAIWQELQDTVHAVDDMNTLTPEEAASQ